MLSRCCVNAEALRLAGVGGTYIWKMLQYQAPNCFHSIMQFQLFIEPDIVSHDFYYSGTKILAFHCHK